MCHVSCAGNAVDYEWRSTGVCTNVLLSSATDTLSLYLESGGGSDCVQVRDNLEGIYLSSVFSDPQETGWNYNRFSVQLLFQTATANLGTHG